MKAGPVFLVVVTVVIVVAVRLYVALAGASSVETLAVDDALITYRYAENIAAGQGFVYNSAERVLGTTSPLYTLILSLFAGIGFSVPSVSLILGLIASGFTAVTLNLFGQRLGLGVYALLPALLYAVWPNAIISDISGLEAPLYTLGIVVFFYSVLNGKYQNAALSAGLMTLLRPEGILCILLLIAFKYASKNRNIIQELIIYLALTVPWLIFSWSYFGSPIPHSIVAKLALYGGIITGTFGERLWLLLSLHTPFGWLALFGWLWGLAYLMMRAYWGWLEALYIVITIIALAASNANLFFWYKAPLAPLYSLFIGAGIVGVFRLVKSLSKNMKPSYIFGALTALTLVAVSVQQVQRMKTLISDQSEIYRTQHQRAGDYLNEHVNAGEIVVAEDIGYLGYTYRGKIFDRDGLISPQAVAFNRALNYSGILESQLIENPGHWLLLTVSSPTTKQILSGGILDESYEIVEDFAQFGSQDYLLYRAIH